MEEKNLTRRNFLKATAVAGGGLVLGLFLPAGGNRYARAMAPEKPFVPNAFLRIGLDDVITVVVKHSEMGQGVATSLPMIAAEELDADWDQVTFEMAPALPEYNHTAFGAQITGGSTSVSTSYEQMRKAGATAKAMLVAAAAKQWGVDAGSCRTENSYVIHDGSKRRAKYSELATAASSMPVPENAPLKSPKSFKLIGKPVKRLDSPSKTNGTAVYGLDVTLPGLMTAVIARPPVFGSKVASYKAEKALAVKGVKSVVQIHAGVAVLADSYWPAKQGRDLLEITWDEANVPKIDSKEQLAHYNKLADTPGAVAGQRGKADEALSKAKHKVEAEYAFPYLAHAPMEPLNCVAHVKDGSCNIWTGTQFQGGDKLATAAMLGIKPEQVSITTVMLGGGFGRRANKNSDYILEAVELSKKAGVPVKTVWTREDDVRGGYYRPMYVHKVKAGVDEKGEPSSWVHRIVGQSIMQGTPFEAFMVKDGVDVSSVEGAGDLAYGIPNLQVEYHLTETTVPTLWWRSVGHTHTAFVAETMIDELAVMGKQDPVEMRLKLLEKHPRHKAVLSLAAEKAGWGKKLDAKPGYRRGRGVAVHESFQSVVAQVADISINKEGQVHVDRVVCAIHCGTVINPNTVEAQMQSAIVYGMSAALFGKISMSKGHVDQSNFHDYPVMRISDMPVVEVFIVPADTPPTGVGEPGTPPIAPAICNAIYAATGKRIRSLPIVSDDLKA